MPFSFYSSIANADKQPVIRQLVLYHPVGSAKSLCPWPTRYRQGLSLYSSPLARPWQNMDERTYAEFTSRLARAARLPFYEAKPLLDEIEQDTQDMPLTRVLSRIHFSLTWLMPNQRESSFQSAATACISAPATISANPPSSVLVPEASFKNRKRSPPVEKTRMLSCPMIFLYVSMVLRNSYN